ncbi:S8 family peptidase [Cellulomonas fimi]|uniref:Peptidase S8 and S53 subtilisin kexin sedolisin n=2 Tax=Cellulomonas fimi TaxID=1708 RepID=F4H1B8_CELFA|nr:S8 family serine peptidase [Cellulomonas fimi]AEE45089.1 peptidase S8 and S53 subtilisin kexin sedolisin [Cellulomonas fimi ATCC 484]VEH28203.1 Subtilisin DY [Cellulomonas fimi]
MRLASRGRTAGAAAVALAVLLAVPATSAGAATTPDGRWYIDAMRLPEIHQVTRGEGVQIAVIDTAVNPAAPDLVGTDLQVREPSFCDPVDGVDVPAATTAVEAEHGTAMTALILGTDAGADGQPGILGVAPDATVRFYATNAHGTPGVDDCPGLGEDAALEEAIDDGADIVSMAFSSAALMHDAIARAHREGVILVAAAGNEPGQVDAPAAYNGVLAVSGADKVGALLPGPSGAQLGVVAPGGEIRVYYGPTWQYSVASGSSTATALTSGAIALAMSRWPDATPNQILQSVVRNTGSQAHELAHTDDYGYGVLNVARIVETDPTQYEDVNPLIAEDTELGPDASEIFGEASDEPTAGGEGGATDTPAEDASSGLGTLAVVGLGVVGLLLVVGVVVLVVTTRRRGSRQAPVAPPPATGHSTFDAVNRGEHHG